MGQRDWDELQDRTTIPWEEFTKEDFINFYWETIAPVLEREGYEVDKPQPAHAYRSLGMGRYIAAIRRHFDCTFKEFLQNEIGLETGGDEHEINWATDDDRTQDLLDDFIDDLRRRNSNIESENTLQRIAYNQNSFLEEFETAHGTSKLVPTLEELDEDEIYDYVLDVYDLLNERVNSVNTKTRYIEDHGKFFSYLSRPGGPLTSNPIPDIAKRFNWTRKEVDALERPALDWEQVQDLWYATETLEEKVLVIAACAWGLRTNEIASLHINNLHFDPGPGAPFNGPVVTFEQRKNQPNPVNVIFGRTVVNERIDQLRNQYGDEWNGYLFPSRDRRSEHLESKSILIRRFKPLANRAGVTVNGKSPNLKMARRFWYHNYWEGQQRLFELVTYAAEEQGSTDPEVVVENYLGDLSRLEFMRLWMRSGLGEAFDNLDLQKEPIFQDKTNLQKVKERLRDMIELVEGVIPSVSEMDEDGRRPLRGYLLAVLCVISVFTVIGL